MKRRPKQKLTPAQRAAQNMAPHKQREALETYWAAKPVRTTRYWYGCDDSYPGCDSEEIHARHKPALEYMSENGKLTPAERTWLMNHRPGDDAEQDLYLALALSREDIRGLDRAGFLRHIQGPLAWEAALTTLRSPEELKNLTHGLPPTKEVATLFLEKLQGDNRGLISQLLRVHHQGQAEAGFGKRYAMAFPGYREMILKVGGEDLRLAQALLHLPYPGGNPQWSEPLLTGTCKKLKKRLPDGDARAVATEILIGLADSWDGTLTELLEASASLS